MVGTFPVRPSIRVEPDGDWTSLIYDPAPGTPLDATGRAQFSVDQGYFTINKGLTIAEWLQELDILLPPAPGAT